MVSLQREPQKCFRFFGKLKKRKKPQVIQEGGKKEIKRQFVIHPLLGNGTSEDKTTRARIYKAQ